MSNELVIVIVEIDVIETDPTWVTFDGREIPLSQLSHQHLSNILYFFDIFHGDEPVLIREELEKRFGGLQLPYYPMITFRNEIQGLVYRGYTTGGLNADIVVDGRWIGRVKYE